MRLGFALAILMSAAAFGQEFHVGGNAAEFVLADLHGAAVSITPGQGEVTVVLFLSAVCPVSNDYNIRINDLYRDFNGKGVKFVFIDANQNEKPAQVEDFARRAHYPVPVYRDPNNVTADRFGAQSRPRPS